MRALVTGGYGYIGGHLVTRLLELGWDVTIVDTMFAARDWSFSCPDRIYALKESVCNADAVSRAMHDVDIVYHLAARMDWDNSPRHPGRLFHTNVMGTATVLAAAHEAGVDNFVFTSSAAVYGDVVEAEELGPTYPINLYGCSKLAAEAVCRHYYNLGMNIKVLRLFNVWGGRFGQSVVNKFLNGSGVIRNDGGQTRDFVYIGDVIKALLAAQNWDPFIYNIGTGNEMTINGLWHTLRGEDKPQYKPVRGEEIYRSCAAVGGTIERTSWRPEVLLADLDRDEVRSLCD